MGCPVDNRYFRGMSLVTLLIIVLIVLLILAVARRV